MGMQFVLSMILYLLQTVSSRNAFELKFRNLLQKYPNIDINAMGFPLTFQNESLWNS
jgi:hypothetical protein